MVVVAAVDRSGRSAHVVSEATSLTAALDEAVHVIHTLTRPEFIDLGLTSAQAGEPKDMDEIRSAATEMAGDSMSGLGVPHKTMGLVGSPANEVIEYADGQDAGYIVMSPRRHSRTGKVLFGSVAQSILLSVSCPVVSTLADEG